MSSAGRRPGLRVDEAAQPAPLKTAWGMPAASKAAPAWPRVRPWSRAETADSRLAWSRDCTGLGGQGPKVRLAVEGRGPEWAQALGQDGRHEAGLATPGEDLGQGDAGAIPTPGGQCGALEGEGPGAGHSGPDRSSPG